MRPLKVARRAGSVCALALLAGPAMAQDTHVNWLRKPTAEQLNAFWPAAAWKAGVPGAGTIKCTVNTRGALEDCAVVGEEPAGFGFGQAALLLAPGFLMKPATKDGKPVASTVRFPVLFRTPSNDNRAAASRLPAEVRGEFRVMKDAMFDRTPTYAEVLAAWPRWVGDAPGGAKASMLCRVTVAGVLRACEFPSVDQGGKGIEKAAESLAAKFHVVVGPGVTAKDLSTLFIAVPVQLINPEQATAERWITRAVWTQTADPAQAQALFPDAAAKAGLKRGVGTLICTVGGAGDLTDCQTQAENPAGLGFGEAAMRIAAVMRMQTWGEDGLPTAGAKVRLPIAVQWSEPAATP